MTTKTNKQEAEFVFKRWLFNPLYWHLKKYLRDHKIRYIFIEGGSSASKTYTISQALSIDAAEHDYGVMVFRKFHVHIKDSVFASFRAAHRQLKFARTVYKEQQDLFKGARGESTKIRFRGLDDPENIKGIEDYNVIYNNEWNQFNLNEFDQQRKRLRGRANQKIICDWNPISSNLWIYKDVIDKETWTDLPLFVRDAPTRFSSLNPEHSFIRINKEGNMIHIKVTYRDNYYVVGHPNGKRGFRDEHTLADFEYDRLHRPNLYRVYANGERGIMRTGQEFFKQFDETKHVRPVLYDSSLPVHVTLDINVNPYVTVAIWQLVGKKLRQIHEIACKAPNNNAPKAAKLLADWLDRVGYKEPFVFVYGDPAGNAKSTVDINNISFFRKFMGTVQDQYKYKVRDLVSKGHPAVSTSAAFLNEIYEFGHKGYEIEISDTCKLSIDDYATVLEDRNGRMVKTKVKDPVTKIEYEINGHFSDAKRYLVCKLLEPEYNVFRLRKQRRGSVAA